ncbi:SAM-dependent methyltransferase [Euzebya tangerina]
MDAERVEWIAAFLNGATSILDLGCGRAALLLACLVRSPATRGFGLDNDPAMIELARAAAEDARLGERARFELTDLSTGDLVSSAEADAVMGIGVTHAFGSLRAQYRAMAAGQATEAVVGASIWERHPPDDLRSMFGRLPRDTVGLGMRATAAGWTVVDAGTSSEEEWDTFEAAWVAGVRSVGTAAAADFADRREALSRRYRGTLGFGWLLLRR